MEVAALFIGELANESGLNLLDSPYGLVEQLTSVRSEHGGKGSTAGRSDRAFDESAFLEPAEEGVHGLPGHERAAGEFRVRGSRGAAEQFEAGVLRGRQAEWSQRLIHARSQHCLDFLELVAHECAEVVIHLRHVSILT